MTYKLFIPSASLMKTAQSTLQMLAMIAGFVAIVAALAGAFYVLTWACGVLVIFIHAFADVCHTAIDATGGNPAVWLSVLIFSFIIGIKIVLAFFPSLPSFFRVSGARA